MTTLFAGDTSRFACDRIVSVNVSGVMLGLGGRGSAQRRFVCALENTYAWQSLFQSVGVEDGVNEHPSLR